MKREKIVFLFHFVLMIDSAIHDLLQTLFLTVSKYFVYSNHTYRDIVLSFGFLKFSLAGGCTDIRNNVPLSAVDQLRPQSTAKLVAWSCASAARIFTPAWFSFPHFLTSTASAAAIARCVRNVLTVRRARFETGKERGFLPSFL